MSEINRRFVLEMDRLRPHFKRCCGGNFGLCDCCGYDISGLPASYVDVNVNDGQRRYCARCWRHQTIPATAVWLRRIGDQAQVLVEIDGKWRLAISEHFDGNFSHIANGLGMDNWPPDPIDTQEPNPMTRTERETIKAFYQDENNPDTRKARDVVLRLIAEVERLEEALETARPQVENVRLWRKFLGYRNVEIAQIDKLLAAWDAALAKVQP